MLPYGRGKDKRQFSMYFFLPNERNELHKPDLYELAAERRLKLRNWFTTRCSRLRLEVTNSCCQRMEKENDLKALVGGQGEKEVEDVDKHSSQSYRN
ncbi:hypothetical protein EJ110_NYTH50302 [Nymphaea thermarum]|nr:hypothetical protein EJ110_NYTH50302 [Nymphaea thermarum]